MTVYIDNKRHVCARGRVVMLSQVFKDNDITAARALRIHLQVYTGHFVGGFFDPSAVYGFGSRGLCFVFTTATRCAWENNNFDINTRSNNAFKEKDPSLVYLFIFFIYNHASIC